MLTASPKQIALIDASLPDWQTLAASLPAGTDIETFTSLAQLGQWARSHTGEYAALHLFSHGASGRLQLGADTLDQASLSLPAIQAQLHTLGQALTPDGDLLLYGCDVAEGRSGLEFISELAQATLADIAASTNLTGTHGDWMLESAYGVLEAANLATDWQGDLSMSITPVRMNYPGKASGEFRNDYAFAALKSDGSVVAWGDSTNGGNSSAVASSLTSGVSQIYSTGFAFAALKSDGSVVTWGNTGNGGNSSAVASSLTSGVSQIYSTGFAFAALKNDGSVVTWGDSGYGGNSSAVASNLASGVSQMCSTAYAFAALKSDGSVITWGYGANGGNSSAVASSLTSGVSQIYSAGAAFAALKSDGSVVTWGDSSSGGNSSAVASSLSSGVSQIYSTGTAFAALKNDGSVVTWGDSSNGGNSSAVASSLASGVSQIYSTAYAFAALKSDGSVITWGDGAKGGNSSAVVSSLTSGVSRIYSTSSAFAALKSDGSVVTWGGSSNGGDSSAVAGNLTSGVSQIYGTNSAFAALKSNGSVITWGSSSYGGDSSAVTSSLSSGVSLIYGTGAAFAALKSDGSVVTWGDSTKGGNSSPVASSLTSSVVGLANFSTDDRYSNSAPTDITLSPGSVQENTSTASALTIGALSSTDPDTGNTFSYSIAGGADQASFQISGANLQFKAGTTLNYETQSSYAVTVRSTDQGGLSYDKTLTVSLSNVNEAPTAASLTSAGLDSATAIAGATVGTLAAVDPDAGDTHTFTLAAGNGSNDADNGKFIVTGNTLKVGATPLAAGTYHVLTRATDAGGYYVNQAQILTITAANVAPVITSGTSASVAENTTTSTVVYTATATDAESDTLSYTLTGTDAASFSIDATSGQVKLLAPADYETQSSYSIIVNAKDATHTTTQALTVNVTDVNEAPTITSGASASVAENAATSTVIYTAAASDPESDALTYALTGTDAASFSINATTGQVRLLTPADYETKNSYSLNIIAADATSHTSSQALTISVSNVNEKPLISAPTTQNVTQGQATVLTGISLADPDAGSGVLTLSVSGEPGVYQAVSGSGVTVSGSGSPSITLTGTQSALNAFLADGQLSCTMLAGMAGPFTISLDSNDGGHSGTGSAQQDSKTLTVTGVPANAAPVITSAASASVAENTATSTVVYTATATDAESDTLSYTLTGTDAAAFAINTTSGQVKLLSPADFETQSSYSIIVNAKDATHTTTQALTLNVTDVNEAPSTISLSASSVAENTSTASALTIGTLSSSDPDAGNTFSYSIVGGADQASFQISGATLQFKAGTALDYETRSSYAVTVRSTDQGGLSYDKALTLNLTDANDKPALTVPASQSVTVGTTTALSGISVADQDAGSNAIAVALSASAGTITATSGGGVTVTGSGTASLSLAGSQSAINAFLSTGHVVYTPAVGASAGGTATLTVGSDDNGFSGGAAQTDSKTMTLNLAAAGGGGGGGGDPTPPDPTPPVTPVTPVTPTEPTTPTTPTVPTEPTTPSVPTTPVDPTPTTPTAPVDPTPVTPTAPVNPVPIVPLVDGVAVTSHTRARPDGSMVDALNIPVIAANRQDQDSSSPQADIALAISQGQTLLKAEVPTGIGMIIEDVSDRPSSRLDLIAAIKSRTVDQPADQQHLVSQGQFFLTSLSSNTDLWVRTVVIRADSSPDASDNLVFRDQTGDSNADTALVLDFSHLPKNSTVAIENINFAAVIGEVNITTGDGNQLLIADSTSQTLDLGAGNDTVYAGGGNDMLSNTRGNDRLFGQGGNDTLSGENGQNLLHGGADADAAKFAGKQDDYTIEQHHGFVKVINKADPSKSTLVVNTETLQFADSALNVQNPPTLNALAGMYQQVLGRQADIYGFDYFGDLQAKGYSMGGMALNMMKTAEGQARGWVLTGDPVNDVEMLYQGLLGRASDAGGKAAWVQAIQSGGMTLEQAANAFVQSGEMHTHYVGPTGWDFLV